jgi:hypothetical protein
MWLTPGGAEMVAQTPDLGARIPDGVRAVEVAGREEAARLWAVHARREAGL